MKNDMIERYVYAVTKKLPSSMREDVSKELNTLISDMLEERCQGVLPTDKDIRVVLTELGTTSELAAQYNNNNGKNCLIGEPYYSSYKTVLKIVLLAAGFGTGLASVLSVFAGDMVPWYEAAFKCIGMVWMGVVFGFAFVTFLFAFFYHKDIALGITENLDELPEVPKKKAAVSKGESIAGIVVCVVFVLLFLIVPQFMGVYFGDGKESIPIFNVDTIRRTWFVVVALGVLGIVGEVVKLIDMCISKRVVITTVIVNVASLFLSYFWLIQSNLFNPEFIEYTVSEKMLVDVMPYMPKFVFGIVVLALVFDTISTFVRMEKGEPRRQGE